MPVKNPLRCCFIALNCLLSLTASHRAVAQETASSHSVPPGTPFAVDVVVSSKHGKSIEQPLTRDDFELLDGKTALPIASVAHGDSTRPLTLWFIVQCPLTAPGYDWNTLGSGFFRGHSESLTAGLKDLDAKATVAVAHWCDNGEFQVDLFPTSDRDAPAASIQSTLTSPPVAIGSAASSQGPSGRGVRGASAGSAYLGSGTAQDALAALIGNIGDLTRLMAPGSVPVLIFIYGDHGGTDIPSVARLLQKVESASAIVYLLNNGAVPPDASRDSETRTLQMYYIHYLGDKTGGRAVEAFHGDYAKELAQIIAELSNRYELGFTPSALDGKQHELRVRLIARARSRLGPVNLRYGSSYIAAPSLEASPVSRMEAELVKALRSQEAYTGIPFDASGRIPAPQALASQARNQGKAATVKIASAADEKSAIPAENCVFRLYVDPKSLSWRKQLKTATSGEVQGLLTASIGIAIASLSAQKTVLSTQSGTLEAHRTEAGYAADQAAKAPNSVLLNIEFPLPREAASIRFVLRDATSGQIGSFELPADRIPGFSPPLSPAKAAVR